MTHTCAALFDQFTRDMEEAGYTVSEWPSVAIPLVGVSPDDRENALRATDVPLKERRLGLCLILYPALPEDK